FGWGGNTLPQRAQFRHRESFVAIAWPTPVIRRAYTRCIFREGTCPLRYHLVVPVPDRPAGMDAGGYRYRMNGISYVCSSSASSVAGKRVRASSTSGAASL